MLARRARGRNTIRLAARHDGTNPWLDAIRHLTRIPRTPPVPKCENHNLGCVDAINDTIRGMLDFPVRRTVNFGDHAPAARELAERCRPFKQLVQPLRCDRRPFASDVVDGFKRSRFRQRGPDDLHRASRLRRDLATEACDRPLPAAT